MKKKASNEAAKRSLKRRGWSYRRAAPLLGVTYQHLCLVLNGRRESVRLIRRIEELPESAA
jgi:hypothetical protein